MRSLDKKTLFPNTGETGDNTATLPAQEFNVERDKGWTFVFNTSSTGTAALNIEAYIGGAWHVIHPQSLSAVGSVMVRDDHGHYEKIRVNGSVTTGEHAVYATGTVDSL